MRYVFFALGLSLMINSSAQTEKRIIELSGTISDKHPIKMILTIQNDKVLGYYYYEKYKTKILLDGQINGTKITLNESPGIESDFKIGFIGNFNGNIISGNWIDKDKNKTFNFKVLIDSDKTMQVSEKIKSIEGNYENIKNSEKYDGSILLQSIIDNIFCFQISTGLEDGCVGYIKGLIEVENLSTGTYSGSLCKELKIIIDADTITVIEKSCDLHGMNCSFNGKYKKK